MFSYFCLTVVATSTLIALIAGQEVEEPSLMDFVDLISVPIIKFRSGGHYYGQVARKGHRNVYVAHGVGSFVDADGRVLYAGRWRDSHMHGVGSRYFADGRNFTGHFRFDQMNGNGEMRYPDGKRFLGIFENNRMVGEGFFEYAGGEQRRGVLDNGVFVGDAVFTDKDKLKWNETWVNGTYNASVKIYEEVTNNYTSVIVKVVCKAHNVLPRVKLFKENAVLKEVKEGEGEIHEASAILPFSDDAFTRYTCQTDDQDGNVISSQKLEIHNPFFLQSQGECGIALEEDFFSDRRRKKRQALKRPLLVGSTSAFRGQVPWQAIINVDSMGDICGGTIISPWHVLTAAHCVLIKGEDQPVSAEDITVKLGYTTKPRSLNGRNYNVSKVYVHPEFQTSGLFNDIALLVVSKKIAIGKYVNPVCLPNHDNVNLEAGVKLHISGFGRTFNASDISRGWFVPNRLQVAGVKLLELSDCFSRQHERLLAFGGHFCAGRGSTSTGFHPDSCDGDSGGPATYKDPINGRHYLVGLVSAGVGECGATPGSVYANVSYYLDWIGRARLHDLVEDYKAEKAIPYGKVDSPIFRAMFGFLLENVDTVLG